MRMALLLAIPALLTLDGCTAIGKISDDDLASYLDLGAKKAASYGIRYAMDKNPDKAAAILQNAQLADQVITAVILPTFTGAGTADVLRSAVDVALAKLDEKLSAEVRLAIQLAINIIATQIKLPDNPAAKLDDRTRKAVVGIFSGLSEGIKEALLPAARELQPKLAWPK